MIRYGIEIVTNFGSRLWNRIGDQSKCCGFLEEFQSRTKGHTPKNYLDYLISYLRHD